MAAMALAIAAMAMGLCLDYAWTMLLVTPPAEEAQSPEQWELKAKLDHSDPRKARRQSPSENIGTDFGTGLHCDSYVSAQFHTISLPSPFRADPE